MAKTKRPTLYEAECPHCGNPVRVRADNTAQKCRWCRRMYTAAATKRGHKTYVELNPATFSTPFTKR